MSFGIKEEKPTLYRSSVNRENFRAWYILIHIEPCEQKH